MLAKRKRPMWRRVAPAGVVVVAAGAVLAVTVPAAAAQPRSPDLGMARLADFHVAHTTAGQKKLRFSASIVNVGSGPFELHADRAAQGSAWAVRQRVYNDDGSYSESAVGVGMVFGGDGHSHWHLRDLESYELQRVDNGVKVGTGMKSGFCFFDTNAYRLSLPGAPQSGVYNAASCGHQEDLSISMGLSIGWADKYPWTLPDQYIDVTALANGRYRLVATADANGNFAESNEANNSTWVDLQLSTRKGAMSVKVLAYGPAA